MDISIPQKRCYKCKERKDRTSENFGPDKRTSDGFRSICKPCRHIENEEALARNPDMYKRQYQKSRQDPEKVEIQRAYQAAYMRKFRTRNREAGMCSQCGTRPAIGARYCDECRKYLREWKTKYPHLESKKKDYARLREQTLEAYEGKCACCGESHPEFLAVDHIDNDGAEHRKSIGTTIDRWLRRHGYPKDKFQLLCHNCNFAKFRYGMCPHKRDS